jgi:hypothetical protein
LDPDLPLSQEADDRLQVSAFVRRLIRPLLAVPPQSSLVLGLYGEWGYGKSTALNFLERALAEVSAAVTPARYAELPAPLVVRFTPWLYSNVDTLLGSFFETIATELGEGEQRPEDKKGRAQALKAVGEFVVPAAKLGAMFLPLGGAVSDRLIEHVAELVGGVTKGAGSVIEGGEVTFRRRKAEAGRALLELWGDRRARRMIVLVDDLDRAAPDEILAMLRLIKLIADLPNISYVIAMDRGRVAGSLDRELAPLRGDDFLEKIVQVGVELPPFEPGALSRMAVESAQAIARDAGLPEAALEVDWSAWRIVRTQSYELHLQRALRTPRDVARLLNTFRFALLTGGGDEDVHPVDMLLLCLLQSRYPRVYAMVRDNRAFLLREEDALSNIFGRDSTQERERAHARTDMLASIAAETEADISVVRASIERVDRTMSMRTIARGQGPIPVEIVLQLFPAVLLDGDVGDVAQATARREGRLCAPEHFDRYFRLERPITVLSSSRIDDVFARLTRPSIDAHDTQRLAEMLATLSSGQMESLTQGLADRAVVMSRDAALGMLACAEALAGGAASHVPADLVALLVYRGLERALATFRSTVSPDQLARDRLAVLGAVDRILRVLSDDDASTLADQLTHDGGRGLGLEPSEAERIAAVGTERAYAFLESYPHAFVDAPPREFVDSVWRCRHLAARAGLVRGEGPYSPLAAFLTRMLDATSGRVSEVLSLAASWGGAEFDHPSFHRSPPGSWRSAIGSYIDVVEVESHVQAVVTAEAVDATRWPHLVRAYHEHLGASSAGDISDQPGE